MVDIMEPKAHLKHEPTERIDPLYELDWRSAITADWYRGGYQQQDWHISASGMLVPVTNWHEDPISLPDSDLFTQNALQIMAILGQFAPLTTAQLSAWTSMVYGRVENTLEALMAAGLLQRAEIDLGIEWRGERAMGSLWRLDISKRKDDPLARWLGKLTDVERRVITQGLDWHQELTGSSGSTIRHNVVGNDLLLRVMEHCDGIAGIWGERFTSAQRILSADILRDKSIRSNMADGAIVTKSGRIIFLEFVGSKRSSNLDRVIKSKVAGWGNIISRTPLDLNVVFVDISGGEGINYLRKQTASALDDIKATQEARRNRARKRIFVADAYSWCPLPGVVSEKMTALEATKSHNGKQVSLLADHTEFTGSDVAINTVAALHVPKWLHP